MGHGAIEIQADCKFFQVDKQMIGKHIMHGRNWRKLNINQTHPFFPWKLLLEVLPNILWFDQFCIRQRKYF